MTPRFNAKEIAKYICKKNNIPLLLGSATPDISTFYKTQKGDIELIKLTKRANESNLANIEIVDLRQELIDGNKSVISNRLSEEIEKNIKNKKQTMLFLNRRGFSTFVICRDCGYTLKCEKCNVSLTYHANINKLKCHYCGYEIKNVNICPNCNSKNIKYFGSGTQKLEESIKEKFPNAKTIRMDTDSINKKNSHEEILKKFQEENIDILIGTQMIIKGHHFPKVTLVGVISADGSLNLQDYKAMENTFQMLTQVAGRAGREKEQGKVIIQTYNPDNFCIEQVKNQDYENFYNTEISIRKELNYPPFCDIILIETNHEKEEIVKSNIKKIYNIIVNNKKILKEDLTVYNPVSCPINKINNRYRYRIIIKTKLNNNIINYLQKCMDIYYKSNTNKVRTIIDINPNNMI